MDQSFFSASSKAGCVGGDVLFIFFTPKFKLMFDLG